MSFLLSLQACSSTPPSSQTVLEPVGPAPPIAVRPGSEGYLVVYSAWSNFVDQGSTGHHSRYTLTSVDGRTREIINHVDRFDEGPLPLRLAPGEYKVRARSAHFGRVTVPVSIRQGQTTFVYLDGQSRPGALAAGQNNPVRLPNGEIVGWSTTLAGNGTP